MGSTAIQIITEAYRHHNLNEVTTFSTMLEFPYNLALDILNDVIRQLNRIGSFTFTETKTALPYSVSTNSYALADLGIDHKRVIRVRKELDGHQNDLTPMNYPDFQRQFRSNPIPSQEPARWAKFGGVLYLDMTPDQDYSLYAYHYRDMPKVTLVSDTFLVPEQDEDLLIDSCFQMLGYKTGRWDLGTALSAISLRANPFLVDEKKDAGIPRQMPSCW